MSTAELATDEFKVVTDDREISISQALLYVVELNDEMARASGVDLTSLGTATDDSIAVARIVRELGLSGRAYISVRNGTRYLVLKGNPGARPVLNGTRYLAGNPKVARIIVGARQMAKGAARATGIAVVAYASLRIVEHILAEDQRNLSQLIGSLVTDVAKFAAASAAGWLAGAAVASVTTVVAGPLIAAIVVGVGVGILLDKVDRKYDLTGLMVRTIENTVDSFQNPFRILARYIQQWEDHLIRQAINNTMRYR